MHITVIMTEVGVDGCIRGVLDEADRMEWFWVGVRSGKCGKLWEGGGGVKV